MYSYYTAILNGYSIFILFIYYCFTAQVLKVCRTPGPTACSKTKMVRLDKVYIYISKNKYYNVNRQGEAGLCNQQRKSRDCFVTLKLKQIKNQLYIFCTARFSITRKNTQQKHSRKYKRGIFLSLSNNISITN